VLLRREGWRVNAKRVWRLYREMGLQLRSKTPKRRVKAKLREGRADAPAANEVWAMDFVHDQLFDGRKIRVLTIIDTFTRLSPAIDVGQLSRRGCGGDARTRSDRNEPTEDDPRRQRPRVCQQGA
jgi:transposase InsO family protein